MNSNITKLPQSEVEISIELSVEELQPYLKKAAAKISETAKIEGFRPGKAPYDIAKGKFGEMAILQEALDDIISTTYTQVVKENNFITIGQPKIDIEKIAPENPLSYKATAVILPEVKIGDFSKLSVKPETVEVTPEKVAEVLEQIRSMRATEKKVDRPAQTGDLVKLDFNVYRDGVPIENGTSKNYPLLIGENRFIPGFEENIIGLKADDEKEFKLNFPDDYHEKSLAGKPAEFKVKILEVAEVVKPELTAEFIKELTANKFSTQTELEENIKKNLTEEMTAENDKKLEIKIWEAAVGASEFTELPELLVHEELHRMQHELEDNLKQQGFDYTAYLNSIKKTPDELEHELHPQAELRVKTSLLARAIYQEQKIDVTPDEVAAKIAEISLNYPPNPEVQKQLESEMYQDYLKNVIGNRKVVDYLKGIIVKQ